MSSSPKSPPATDPQNTTPREPTPRGSKPPVLPVLPDIRTLVRLRVLDDSDSWTSLEVLQRSEPTIKWSSPLDMLCASFAALDEWCRKSRFCDSECRTAATNPHKIGCALSICKVPNQSLNLPQSRCISPVLLTTAMWQHRETWIHQNPTFSAKRS